MNSRVREHEMNMPSITQELNNVESIVNNRFTNLHNFLQINKEIGLYIKTRVAHLVLSTYTIKLYALNKTLAV